MSYPPSPVDDMRYGIVLGGGRSSRMGTDKLELRRDGQTLLQQVVEAALGCCGLVVVASPHRLGFDDPRVAFAVEDPPFGGPAAGLAAAVAELPPAPPEGGEAEVLLLAGDLAFADEVVGLLLAAELGPDGVVLMDSEGWPQYLAARYRLPALRRTLQGQRNCRDKSIRRVLGDLNLARLEVSNSVMIDLDTPKIARECGFGIRVDSVDEESLKGV